MFRHYSTTSTVAKFLAACHVKGLSPRTLETYQCRLQRFARSCPRLPVNPTEIEQFLAGVGPTMETRDSYYRLLRDFYNWLVRRKMARHNPVLDIDCPRLPRKVARSLAPAELGRLLTHPGHSTQMSAFLYLLADTGLRISEALSITAQHIRDYTVIVQGKTGQRELPISPVVAHMVLEALPWPWKTRTGASHAVIKAFRRSGLSGKRASAHSLRHTFCRLWEGDESLLVNILGWTTPAMLRVYKPYNLDRAIDQHRTHSPLRLAQATAAQLMLL